MCPLQAMPKQWSVVAIPAARTCRRSSARPVIQRMRAQPDARAAARKNRGRLGRHPHPREAELAADLEHQPPDGRMQVHVLVRIGVVRASARWRRRRRTARGSRRRAGDGMRGRTK